MIPDQQNLVCFTNERYNNDALTCFQKAEL